MSATIKASDLNIQDLVEKLVGDKISEKALFTAYDITLLVRAEGKFALNRDVRDIVHTVYLTGGMGIGYKRELITIPDVQEEPWLYLPKWCDKNDYQGIKNKKPTKTSIFNGISMLTTSGKSVTPHPMKTASISVVGGVHGKGANANKNSGGNAIVSNSAPQTLKISGAYTTDSRGRLCIPRKLIEAMGLAPHDFAYVMIYPQDEELCVSRFGSMSAAPYHLYKVDKSCNVRIERKLLVSAGIEDQVYNIVGDANNITITIFA